MGYSKRSSKRSSRGSSRHSSKGSSSQCPPGLHYLASTDKLIVEQQIDVLEVFTGWESSNRYSVKNHGGHTVYYAVEQSDVFTMNMMGSSRPFDMLIMDPMRVSVLRARRPYQIQGCGCCGCVQEIEVSTGHGHLLGGVVEVYSCGGKKFDINDSRGKTVLKIEGPACLCACTDIDFNVLTADGRHKIGAITRRYPGWLKQSYTHADEYGVKFPRDLDVKMKATLLGATFLIDFMYFEKKMEDTNLNKHHEQNGQYGSRGYGGNNYQYGQFGSRY